jgi:hypothetical protein
LRTADELVTSTLRVRANFQSYISSSLSRIGAYSAPHTRASFVSWAKEVIFTDDPHRSRARLQIAMSPAASTGAACSNLKSRRTVPAGGAPGVGEEGKAAARKVMTFSATV